MNTCATCNASHKNTVDRVLRAGFAWLGRTEIATGDRLGITPMSPAAEGRPVDRRVSPHLRRTKNIHTKPLTMRYVCI